MEAGGENKETNKKPLNNSNYLRESKGSLGGGLNEILPVHLGRRVSLIAPELEKKLIS